MSKIQMTPLSVDDKEAALKAIMAYKAQNPAKFAAKKENLLRKYGLVEEETVEVVDEVQKELEEIAKKVTKKSKKTE